MPANPMTRFCKDCQTPFELDTGQIAFYEERQLALPRRCEQCRRARKQARLTQNAEEIAARAGYRLWATDAAEE